MSDPSVAGRESPASQGLTESEVAALVPLLFAAIVVAAGWVIGRAEVSLHPLFVLALAVVATAAALIAIAMRRREWHVARSTSRFAGFLLVVFGFTAYICWLAWPSLLPLTDGPDLVHHLTLIHVIQDRHALVHDPSLGKYLGEMASYTPGSHILAALAAEWLRVDALQIVHPLQAVAVAVKAGVLYNTFGRILPESRANVARALAGTGLLLLPFQYLLDPLTRFGFYSQVVAETFAVAILWTLVAWYQAPSRVWLTLAALFAMAVVLCWPVYLPACALAVMLVVLAPLVKTRRWRSRVLIDPLLVLGPAAYIISTFFTRHGGSAGILRSGGSVLVPSVQLFGWTYLLLTVAGFVLALRHLRTYAPVLAFAAACVAQAAALAVLQLQLGATNLYLANKTIFLLVCVTTLFGGLALSSIWLTLAERAPSRVRGPLALALPVVVLSLLTFRQLPSRPTTSPFPESLRRAGEWARANVPVGCVDYFVEPWVTGYWLHLDVLGNPRASERIRTETFEYRATVSRWILPGGLPFAIVGNLRDVPADARRNMDVLQQFGSAAVVRRSDGRGECRDTSLPIHDVSTSERR